MGNVDRLALLLRRLAARGPQEGGGPDGIFSARLQGPATDRFRIAMR